jgi:hypothetical protein
MAVPASSSLTALCQETRLTRHLIASCLSRSRCTSWARDALPPRPVRRSRVHPPAGGAAEQPQGLRPRSALRGYIVVTGLSGAGKSSLVFDTLHAEGQRRYVETFSAYTRQFLDLLDKPKVDSIENIRPSIAIEQTNTVKTSRSTVGTMTELTDFFKVWFSHVAACYDPATGEKVEDDTPATIWENPPPSGRSHGHRRVPDHQARESHLARDPDQSETASPTSGCSSPRPRRQPSPVAQRIDDLLADGAPLAAQGDVCGPGPHRGRRGSATSRFLEADETALHFGQGQVHLIDGDRLHRNRPLLARTALAEDRPHLPRRLPRPLLLQLAARRLSEVPRLRPGHRHRLPARDSRPVDVDRRRRDQVLGGRSLRRIEEGPAHSSPANGKSRPRPVRLAHRRSSRPS